MSVPAVEQRQAEALEVRYLRAVAYADVLSSMYGPHHALSTAARVNRVDEGRLATLLWVKAVAATRARQWLRAVEAGDAALASSVDALKSTGRRPLVVSRPRKRA
jgi:hypothetical protein